MLKRWVCLIFVLLTFPAQVPAQESYLVAYAGFAGFQAPVWAPKDLGLFSKYGFNGDVVLVPGSVRQIQAIVDGSIHFAQADAATAVNAINQGLDLVMISGTLNSFPYSLVTQKEIRRPEDLIGKKIGTLAVGRRHRNRDLSCAQGVEHPAPIGYDLPRRRFGGSDCSPFGQGY